MSLPSQFEFYHLDNSTQTKIKCHEVQYKRAFYCPICTRDFTIEWIEQNYGYMNQHIVIIPQQQYTSMYGGTNTNPFSTNPQNQTQGTNTMPKGQTKIWWDVNATCYRMSMSYNPQAVDFLKNTIPSGDRDWDPVNKVWSFHEKYLDLTIKFAKMVFQHVTVISKLDAEKAKANASQQTNTASAPARNILIDNVISDFVKTLGFDAMKKAYYHALMINHPDKGGSTEITAKLNAAWQRIEKEVFGK